MCHEPAVRGQSGKNNQRQPSIFRKQTVSLKKSMNVLLLLLFLTLHFGDGKTKLRETSSGSFLPWPSCNQLKVIAGKSFKSISLVALMKIRA